MPVLVYRLDTRESMSVRETLKSEVLAAVKSSIQISKCGEGLWHKIVHLNMSDPNEYCPSVWKEYTAPVRTCGRQVSSVSSYPSNTLTAAMDTSTIGYVEECLDIPIIIQMPSMD